MPDNFLIASRTDLMLTRLVDDFRLEKLSNFFFDKDDLSFELKDFDIVFYSMIISRYENQEVCYGFCTIDALNPKSQND